MIASETRARDQKLVQYLGEAYGSERRRQASLEAHISTATRAPYKKRLQQHLGESRRHAEALWRRMRQLRGAPPVLSAMPTSLGSAAEAVIDSAQKATALARGPLRALLGTGEAERELRNARSEYAQEAQEVGMYSALEALARAVADADTEQLARELLRDEQRMMAYLEREIPRMTTAVARAEIPASQRNGAVGGARRARSKHRSSATGSSRSRSARTSATSRRSASRVARVGASRTRSGWDAGAARRSVALASTRSATLS
jgi:ferritin-like metal-binding protein YciE